MATESMKLNPEDFPTKEQLEEIKAASKKPVTFTDDAPNLTDDELHEFRPANPKYYRQS